ncbi:unnamed protein product [Clonostachys rosea f. rosea IK726]|uniref:Uncharacterized protein n=1 Tax=Clonostachys rosea f. rosea IK726 TaxID=1349383 RepID=A0ACA9T5J9_BIOOC|nr:unnamed protein product [Clonostachys rosea f. rosea IK726]
MLQLENEDFWSDMPQMSLTLADYHYTGYVQVKDVDMFDNQDDEHYERFLPEFWPKWEAFLQVCQKVGQHLDEDTQEPIEHALKNMNGIEAERRP